LGPAEGSNHILDVDNEQHAIVAIHDDIMLGDSGDDLVLRRMATIVTATGSAMLLQCCW
jgi:hypothetical protein